MSPRLSLVSAECSGLSFRSTTTVVRHSPLVSFNQTEAHTRLSTEYVATTGQIVGLYVGLLVIHGLLNSMRTRELALTTRAYVFINIGATLVIILTLFITSAMQGDIHTAEYAFTTVNNQSGYSSDGLAFLFGLLSVSWTMTE